MAFIKIGGLSFDSFEELFEYKRTHPEWDAGGNNIIDKVGPGETVTYNFGSVNGGSDKSSHSSHRTVHTTIHNSSRSSGRTVIVNGSVEVIRNGQKHTIRGNNIEKHDGQWYVDGRPVDWSELGGEYEQQNVVRIEITGTVQNLATTSGDVTVHGDVQNLRTGSGDVECENAVNVNTGSGDVHCKNITGMVSTGSGDIYG